MKNIILLVIVTFLSISCGVDPHSTKPARQDEIKKAVDEILNDSKIPGIQISVIDNKTGEEIFYSSGFSDFENQIKMTNNAILKIGSITKSFTALSILILADEGKLNLNDSIGLYFNSIEDQFKNITIIELMNMNSGLSCYFNDDNNEYVDNQIEGNHSRYFSPEELMELGLNISKGNGILGKDVFHYNNTNYIMLGIIIEKVSGYNYSDFIKIKITDRLNLNSTFVPENNSYPQNLAEGYYINLENDKITNYTDVDLSYVWSAGALISNASDLCRWISAVASSQIIFGETENYIYNGFKIDEGVHYTSGLLYESMNSKLWHNGTVHGYHGELSYLKDRQIAIAVLSNVNIIGIEKDHVKELMNKIIEIVSD